MTHRLTTNYAKNYCNRTLIVKVIVENVVTCFFLGHGVVARMCYVLVFRLSTYAHPPVVNILMSTQKALLLVCKWVKFLC